MDLKIKLCDINQEMVNAWKNSFEAYPEVEITKGNIFEIDADALVIVTEWQDFLNPDWQLIKRSLKHKVIFDGRNIYDPSHLASLGIDYFGIGRSVCPLCSNHLKSCNKPCK